MTVQIDAFLGTDGDLPEVSRLITGIELVEQRIRLRLQRGTGEWFLDPSVGLPLLEWAQQKPPKVQQIVGQIQAEIRLVPGVISTANFQGVHDQAARRLTVTGDVIADGGEVTSVVVSGSSEPSHNTMSFSVFFASGNIRGGIARPSTGRP